MFDESSDNTSEAHNDASDSTTSPKSQLIQEQLNDYLLENEPRRITPNDVDTILEHCCAINASDITLQTNEPIIAEVYGRLCHITKRRLNNAEVGAVLTQYTGQTVPHNY